MKSYLQHRSGVSKGDIISSKVTMKRYIVRAVRYEDIQIFGIKDMAECSSREDAEEIVSALEATDMAVFYHYGVIEL